MNFFSIPLHRSLIQKYHVNPVKKEIIFYARGDMLDIGCGNKPFYQFIKHHVDSYVGLEHPDTPHDKTLADVFGSADNLPFEENKFDVVVLTQVIEHVENPGKVMLEIFRVLRKEGICIVAWPFLYPIHEEPRDYYRYTLFGISTLAKEAGLKIEKMVPVSGFWITWFGFISIYVFGKSGFLYLMMYLPLLLLKALCVFLQTLDRNQRAKERWTWNYFAILRKES